MSPGVVKEELTTDPMMSTSDEMIGSTAVWASGYTGAGRKIAIIDTGIDVDHPALDPDALAYALEGSNASLMTSADTAKVLSQLNAAKQYKGLTAEDLYVNAKIPFGFNYVDNGLNIGHDKDTQGDHGSHVAGIAAANRYVKAEDGSFANALGYCSDPGRGSRRPASGDEGLWRHRRRLSRRLHGRRGGRHGAGR